MAAALLTSEQMAAEIPEQVDHNAGITSGQDSGDLPLLVVIGLRGFESQAPYGIDVLCRWDRLILQDALQKAKTGFFILTRCASLHQLRRNAIIDEIRCAVKDAALVASKRFDILVHDHDAIPGHVVGRLGISQTPERSPLGLNIDLAPFALGGLLIEGSCSPAVTQLEGITGSNVDPLSTVIIDGQVLLEADLNTFEDVVLRAAEQAGERILVGKDVLLLVNRETVDAATLCDDESLQQLITRSIVCFLQLLNTRPRYIAVREGFLAFAAATRGLQMRRMSITGQTSSGIPVWKCNDKMSKFAGIPYAMLPRGAKSNADLQGLATEWSKAAPQRSNSYPMQYQRLGKSALKISRVILGCMTFGNPNWQGSPWVMPESEALPLLKKAYDVGINTWDTADTYSNGESERLIGKALSKYSIPREKVVIMTKLYYPVMNEAPNSRPDPAINDGPLVNQMGLSRKHVFAAVDASLDRLGTHYIDVLQLHRLDKDASAEEIMCALHDLVRQGKVHYLGGSSMYTYQFAHLQYTAKMNDWTPFSSMQNLYNLIYREEERDMNPFCEQQGIGLIPWSPVARGLLARPSQSQSERSVKDKKTQKWFKGKANDTIIERVETLAREKNTSMAGIALAWLLTKNCCPIVGLNSIERIEKVSEALYIELSLDDLAFLEEEYEPQKVVAI